MKYWEKGTRALTREEVAEALVDMSASATVIDQFWRAPERVQHAFMARWLRRQRMVHSPVEERAGAIARAIEKRRRKGTKRLEAVRATMTSMGGMEILLDVEEAEFTNQPMPTLEPGESVFEVEPAWTPTEGA